MRMLLLTGAWLLMFQLLTAQEELTESAPISEPPVRNILSDSGQDLDTTTTSEPGEIMQPDQSQQPMIGWLELAGDADATVWLNGLTIGTTPIDRLALHGGSYQLILTKPEYKWYGADVTIQNDQISTVNYTLQEQPGKKATALSIVLPGSGQIYQGDYKGWIYLELALVLGYSALVFQQDFSICYDTYIKSLDDYNNETDASVALEKREVLQKDFDDMKQSEKHRNFCLGTLGAIWIFNIVDIAF